VERHLTDIQLLLGVFSLALITIFAVAAILDGRWRKPVRHRAFRSDLSSDFDSKSRTFDGD
jgi:hypothetical protein